MPWPIVPSTALSSKIMLKNTLFLNPFFKIYLINVLFVS